MKPKQKSSHARAQRQGKQNKGKAFAQRQPQTERAGRSPRPNTPKNTPQKSGQVLFGVHAVTEAWLNPARQCLRLHLTPSAQKNLEGTFARAKKMGLHRPDPIVADPKFLDRLAGVGAVHQGIVLEAGGLPEVDLFDLLESENAPRCFVMLDQVTDPHNVGAILRTACAFGVGGLLMTERHAASATGTLAKTASGALEHTPMIRVPNLAQAMQKLQKAGYWCVGLDETGAQALHEITMPDRVVLVLGAEGEGLRRLTRETCDAIVRLPTAPPIGSLNVSNAAAVAIYEMMKRFG